MGVGCREAKMVGGLNGLPGAIWCDLTKQMMKFTTAWLCMPAYCRSPPSLTSYPGLLPRLYVSAVEKSRGCEIKFWREAWVRGYSLPPSLGTDVLEGGGVIMYSKARSLEWAVEKYEVDKYCVGRYSLNSPPPNTAHFECCKWSVKEKKYLLRLLSRESTERFDPPPLLPPLQSISQQLQHKPWCT